MRNGEARGLKNLAFSAAIETGRELPVVKLLIGSLVPEGQRGDSYPDFIRYNTEMIAEAALDTMEITDLANRQVGELSGGRQQRVMLSRTLARDADLLLLDEPLNALRKANFEGITCLFDLGVESFVTDYPVMILEVVCEYQKGQARK